MSGRHVDAALTLTAVRPRDRKLKVGMTWMGEGRQGEGKEEEEDPLHLEAVAVVAAIASDETLEPVGASWVLGVGLGEEAWPLPVRRCRRQPCEQA